jgi:hypothetical protein
MLAGCGLPRATTSISSALPFGSSVETLCKISDPKYTELRNYSGNSKVIETCSIDSFVEYFPEFKTQIIRGQGGSTYFVFENVNQKMTCNSLYCSYGDGKLKFITTNGSEAQRMANPNDMAQYKKELEEIEFKEAKKLKDKEAYEKKVKLENLDKAYGKKCLTKKNNISDYNTCLFNQERVALAEKQEQDRKVNKAKLEEQNKLSTMPPSERYAYTCEKTYGFKKGSDNFRDCVFKIMTTEYEMQRASDQRRIAELESKINNNSSNYNSELLEIERLKAKALQDQANAIRNRNQTDALMDLSRSLLNNNNRAPANVPNLPLNCRSVRVGNTVQTQCY